MGRKTKEVRANSREGATQTEISKKPTEALKPGKMERKPPLTDHQKTKKGDPNNSRLQGKAPFI
jgi:hypothetical protein